MVPRRIQKLPNLPQPLALTWHSHQPPPDSHSLTAPSPAVLPTEKHTDNLTRAGDCCESTCRPDSPLFARFNPTAVPTSSPTSTPTSIPTSFPTALSTTSPGVHPSAHEDTAAPSAHPTASPTTRQDPPNTSPTLSPTSSMCTKEGKGTTVLTYLPVNPIVCSDGSTTSQKTWLADENCEPWGRRALSVGRNGARAILTQRHVVPLLWRSGANIMRLTTGLSLVPENYDYHVDTGTTAAAHRTESTTTANKIASGTCILHSAGLAQHSFVRVPHPSDTQIAFRPILTPKITRTRYGLLIDERYGSVFDADTTPLPAGRTWSLFH